MAYQKLKIEMHGDTSRYGHREDVKKASRKKRRVVDKKTARSRA